jgi:hypothetical protein
MTPIFLSCQRLFDELSFLETSLFLKRRAKVTVGVAHVDGQEISGRGHLFLQTRRKKIG